MIVSGITVLSQDEVVKKQQLENLIIEGIESGKRGFQQAAQALLSIDELALWRDEAVSFDAYRQKFKAVLEDLEITDRHLNRLIAAEKCVQMLRPIGLNISQHRESHIRPLTQLKEPRQIQQAYKRALDIALDERCDLKAEHVQRAVEEIKPPKTKLKKPPRPPIGATVRIAAHYADEELAGTEGVVVQRPSIDRCTVRLGSETRKLIPDGLLTVIEEEPTSVKQELKQQGRSLGVGTGLQALPDQPRNEGIEPQSAEVEMMIAAFLRVLPKLSRQQKVLVYERLSKSLEVAA